MGVCKTFDGWLHEEPLKTTKLSKLGGGHLRKVGDSTVLPKVLSVYDSSWGSYGNVTILAERILRLLSNQGLKHEQFLSYSYNKNVTR